MEPTFKFTPEESEELENCLIDMRRAARTYEACCDALRAKYVPETEAFDYYVRLDGIYYFVDRDEE